MKTRACCIGLVVGTALLLAQPAAAANVLYLVGGKTMAFKSIRWDSSKNEYQVQAAGGGDASYPVAKKDVIRLEMDPPAEMVQAQQLLAANRNNEAIAPLQAVIASCRNLNWDNTARETLARIYVKNNDPAKAVKMVDELLAAGAGSIITSGLRVEYWKALLSLDPKSPKALKDFGEAIATGPRDGVPMAQLMRGDMLRAAGRKDDALQDYLRTILFFENAGSVRTEALNKAIEIYTELGDTARATELRQKLDKK